MSCDEACKLRGQLKALAVKKAWTDDKDFSVYEASGGNIDDAYTYGRDDGEILLARELLKKYFDEVTTQGERP